MLGQGGGGAPAVLYATINLGGTTVGRVIIDLARKEIRTRGGNVQAVLGK
jgi:hypothetical protein